MTLLNETRRKDARLSALTARQTSEKELSYTFSEVGVSAFPAKASETPFSNALTRTLRRVSADPAPAPVTAVPLPVPVSVTPERKHEPPPLKVTEPLTVTPSAPTSETFCASDETATSAAYVPAFSAMTVPSVAAEAAVVSSSAVSKENFGSF